MTLPQWGFCIFLCLSMLLWAYRREGVYTLALCYILSLANAVVCFHLLGYELAQDELLRNPLTRATTFLLATTCFSALVILLFSLASNLAKENLNADLILRIGLPITSIIGALLYFFFGVKIIPHDSTNATLIALGLPYIFDAFKKNHWFAPIIILIAVSIVLK